MDGAKKTRFEKLHTPGRVALVERLAMLALEAEDETGKPILYQTQWDLAAALNVGHPAVACAFRLSYTAEFFEQYAYGFIPTGNGRNGGIYGYVLEHDKSKVATDNALDALGDNGVKLSDHLRGLAAHQEHIKTAHGANTTIGKKAQRNAEILRGAAASVNDTTD